MRASWWTRSSSPRSSRWPTERRARSVRAPTSTRRSCEPAAGIGQGRAREQRLELVLSRARPARARCVGRARASAAPAGPPRRRRAPPAWRRRWASRRVRRRPGRGWGSRARGRSRRPRGVRTAATARISASSENGSRSSTEPPPRATTMTSTSGSRSRAPIASITSAAGVDALHRGVPHREADPGQRRWACSTTSRSAAEPWPVTRPTVRGRNGSGRFSSGANRPSAASSRRSRSSRASSSPSPTSRISRTCSEMLPAVGVEGRLRVAHDLGALDQGRGQAVEHAARAGDRDRDVGQLVAQGQEDGVGAPAAADLRHLALDPDGTEPVDPGGDRLRDLAHRRRMLGRGLQRHVEDTKGSATYHLTHDRSRYAGRPLAGAGRPRRAPRRSARLLRGRRPRRDHGGEGAGPLRRAGLRAQADRAQQARGRRPRGARGGLRRGARRGARGRDRRLLRARGLAGRARAGRRRVA